MRLDRAAKFGLYGTIGIVIVSLGTYRLIGEIQSGTQAGTMEGDITILMILIAGTAVNMLLLFTLIGEYLDRELASRGLGRSEE